MAKHASQEMTLGEVINRMADSNHDDPWFVTIDVPRLTRLYATAKDVDEDEAWDAADAAEAETITKFRDSVITVTWPEHVTVPRLNGDATYHHEIV